MSYQNQHIRIWDLRQISAKMYKHHSITQYNKILVEKKEAVKLPLIPGNRALYLNTSKKVDK